jgi:hypothetical protein
VKNDLRQIELIIYNLKKHYGLPAYLRKPTKNENDVTTGKVVTEYEVFKIRKLICLPDESKRQFIYDLSYVAANKNFAYGGLFDRSIKMFILDRKDTKIDVTLADNLVRDGRRYDIIDIDKPEHNVCFLLKAKMLDSSPIILDP